MVFAPGAIACISHWAPTCINSWGLVERAIACIRIGPLPKMCIHNHCGVLPHMLFYTCSNCVLPTIAITCIIHWAPNCMGLVEKAFASILIGPLRKTWCIHNHFGVLPERRFNACYHCALHQKANACIIHWVSSRIDSRGLVNKQMHAY